MKDRIAYDLNKQARAARDLVAALKGEDEDLVHDMTEGETDLFEAIDAALAEIDECALIIDGCKAREAEFESRRLRAERRRETVRTLVEQAILLAEVGTVRRPTGTLTVSLVKPKPIVTDESAVPTKFWKQPEPVLDKAAINAAAKAGESIPGVSMTNGGSRLTIRRA